MTDIESAGWRGDPALYEEVDGRPVFCPFMKYHTEGPEQGKYECYFCGMLVKKEDMTPHRHLCAGEYEHCTLYNGTARHGRT